jgi:hypothetical protein
MAKSFSGSDAADRLLVAFGCLLLTFVATQAQQQNSAQGPISGHVYNAETRMPIPGATVVLTNSQTHADFSSRTDSDGSYSIRNATSGSYFLAAYADHFLGQYLGDKIEDRRGAWTEVAVGREPKVLDLYLHHEAEITAINDAPIAAALGARLPDTSVVAGKFSRDGKFFALMTLDGDNHSQVWRYDLGARRLEHITDRDQILVDMAWSDDGTLYVKSEIFQKVRHANQPPPLLLTAATATAIRTVDALPAAIVKSLEEERHEPLTPLINGLANRFYQENDVYRVTVATTKGNSTVLFVEERKGSKRTRQIALDGYRFIFDREHSEIVYQRSSRSFHQGAVISILSLQTGRSRDVFLPLWSDGPLDRSKDGSVLAVAARGDCIPTENVRLQFIHPERATTPAGVREPRHHACLVKL